MPPAGRKIVQPGQTIESVGWGNPAWDHTVQCFASSADRAAQFPSPHEGAVTFRADTSALEIFFAGAWRTVNTQIPVIARGQVGVNALAAGGTVDTTIVTLVNFTAPPGAVTVGYKGSANANVVVEILTLTATQLQFRVRNNGGSATTGAVHFIAIA